VAAGRISYSSVNRVLFVPGLTVLEVHYDGHTSVGGYGITASSSRLHCWVESLILGLGIPSAIWAVSPVISVSIPAAVHVPGGARLLLAERGRSGRAAPHFGLCCGTADFPSESLAFGV
jgi:hypothetical protein